MCELQGCKCRRDGGERLRRPAARDRPRQHPDRATAARQRGGKGAATAPGAAPQKGMRSTGWRRSGDEAFLEFRDGAGYRRPVEVEVGKRHAQAAKARSEGIDVCFRKSDGIVLRGRRPFAKESAGSSGIPDVLGNQAELTASGLDLSHAGVR